MLWKIISSSIRFRLNLYVPMLVAVVISLSLIGAAEIVGNSFREIVNREMKKYGANVILTPEKDIEVNQGVAVSVKDAEFRNAEVSLASTNIKELLKLNPAWLVKGNGNILVGRTVAEQFNIAEGSLVEIEDIKGHAAILDSGTEFDSFIIVNGKVQKPSMILIRTDEPEKYRGRKDAIIREEIVKTKYKFLESIKRLMLYVAIISAVSSMAAVVNLARIDAGDRRKEFGVFKALGAFSNTIAKIVLSELTVLSSISGALGLLASLALSWLILSLTADTSPVMNFKSVLYVFATSFVAFGLTFLIYIFESRTRDVVREIRGE